MKYEFKIRFNTEHAKTPGLFWRVLINDEEKLVANVIINKVSVKTASHTLESGEKKWSITCQSDSYHINEQNEIEIADL